MSRFGMLCESATRGRGRWRGAWFATSILLIAAILVGMLGCSGPPDTPQPTSLATRAKRRAYDGAPPVIPHKPLGAKCSTCHDGAGKQVPDLGFAPANPHLATQVAGGCQDCRQCHLFRATRELFATTSFRGLEQVRSDQPSSSIGAPPVMAHPLFMRENCRACHAGPAARPEILCSHPDRTNCVQCHVARRVASSWPP